MFDIFGSTSNKQRASTLVNEYIQRNANEFLNPIKTYPPSTLSDFEDDVDLNACWSRMLELDRNVFMKGWKPTTNQFKSLYDQLFQHYFDYPNETEEAIRSLKRPLQWFPLQWFSNGKALSTSGRMGPVYIMSCKIPHQTESKTMIIREINLCMVKQQEILTIPNRVIGITAVPSKHKVHHYKLAFVSVAIEHSLEQLIPQVDQWTFQKTCRLALSLASTVRDLHKRDLVHPNLQPRNVLVSNVYDEHALKLELVDGQDDWPSIPLSTRYGRYPYISPEICYHHANTITKQSNIYSLGIMLWQLVSGVVFPSSVAICPRAYQITLLKHIDPAYQDLVVQCLSKDSENRPAAETVCEALVRIIMSGMNFRTSTTGNNTNQLAGKYVSGIRERQMTVAKYLISCRAKSDLEELMQGASLSKRMTIHVLLSLQWRSNSPSHAPVSRSKCYTEEDDMCEDVHGRYIPACVNRKKQIYQKRIYRIAPAKEVYCGADLPELMQMGMV